MAVLPPFHSPRAALRDLGAFLRQRSREHAIALVASIAITLLILVIFVLDARVNTAPPKTVIFVESFSANRTDAEIKADQADRKAAREAALKERQRQFQKLQKQLDIE